MRLLTALLMSLIVFPVHAGEADVLEVRVTKEAGGTFRVDVTVQHADTGWDHYADGWEVTTEDGVQLGHRTLYHPHVNEQPFTRSLSGVSVPEDVETIVVRAHDSVHGWGGRTIAVELPK
jgi:hypothetical protein